MKRAIILMFDSLNRHMLQPYVRDTLVDGPNFNRLAERAVTFERFYAGSMPCIPARREMHTGRHNFLHRSWGPLEPFDDSMPERLDHSGIHTHLATDHPHYWEDGGASYHTRYTTFEFFRGQEGDPWKGVVDEQEEPLTHGSPSLLRRQEMINRHYIPTEADHYQTQTVDAGVHFLETNAKADRWMLQLELFDPHEPFFTHQHYKDLYPHDYDGPEFDWPGYQKVVEPSDQVEHARYEYAALVSMCDRSLGRVLDVMDGHNMWDDTMLIVNTDHGFLLGEHGWWAKSVQPWFDELVHLPMFMWDPRTRGRGVRRGALAQTIDIAPTVLHYFGLEPGPDVQGQDLGQVLADESEMREGALFGIFGGHVNVTDGRYTYMRGAADASNSPLEEHTLMPTHMRSRFSVDELRKWEPAEPFTFTKGVRTMRLPATSTWTNSWLHGTLLFDLDEDPHQERPLEDDEVELRMLRLLARLMHETEAPRSQFERLGIPYDGEPGPEHLLVREQAHRAAETAEPLPPLTELPAHDLLTTPLSELLEHSEARQVVERHAPELINTELITMPMAVTLLGLARFAAIPRRTLEALANDLAGVPDLRK